MSLSAAYHDANKPDHPFPQCKTCKWYGALNSEDKKFFNSKVEVDKPNKAALLRACELSGLEVVVSSLSTHLEKHHAKVRDL